MTGRVENTTRLGTWTKDMTIDLIIDWDDSCDECGAPADVAVEMDEASPALCRRCAVEFHELLGAFLTRTAFEKGGAK